jgi:drug/metabolite transporter (DMT)-like permease
VVIYLQPILIGVLAWFVLGEPLSAGKMLGLLLGFAGIVAVSSAGFSGEISAAGVAFAVASALSWALGTVYFKKVQERVSMLWAVALPFLSGGILLSILGLATERPADISWSGPYVASLLYSGLVGTGLAWVLWLGLVRAGEASRVAAYVFFVPLVSVVIGAVFLHERLGLSLLVGAALVVSGIYLANRTSGEDKRPLKRRACCEKMRARGKERRNIEQQTRPPSRPLTRRRRGRRSRPPRRPGTPATPRRCRWPTRRTRSGATATSSSKGGKRLGTS